jgi:hypothetical protein
MKKTTTYGLLAGLVGLGAWWYARQRANVNQTGQHRVRERGTVIFDNTPTASELPSEA